MTFGLLAMAAERGMVSALVSFFLFFSFTDEVALFANPAGNDV